MENRAGGGRRIECGISKVMPKLIKSMFIMLVILLMFPAVSLAATPLHDKPPGSVITFSNKQWIILEQKSDGTTYIILNDEGEDKSFDPDNEQLFNPDDSNNIGYYLNNNFYNNLSQRDMIETHSWDIKFQDNTGNQTNVTCKIALISYAEYSAYRNLFPSKGTGYIWWTRTPASYKSYFNWYVNTQGSLSYSVTNSAFVIRPTLYLKSGYMVSDTGEVIQITPPVTPTGLSGTAIGSTQVQLTWQPNSEPDLAGYIVYRDYVEICRVGALSTSFIDSGLQPDSTYTYGIKAYDSSNSISSMSNAATVTTPKPPTPSGLTCSNITLMSARASWNAVIGADSYNVYLDGSPVYNTAQTQYDITDLESGTTHTVEVRTVISGVESDPATVSFTTGSPPAAPTGLAANATAFNQVQLTWQANTETDLAGYIIYRDYMEIARVSKGTTNYTDNGLAPNETYTYGIKAYNTSNIESDMSNAATVTTPKPPAPSGLNISNITGTGGKVTWNAVADADSYNIYLDSYPVYNTTALEYDLSGLAPATSYTVEVRTVINEVESEPVTPLSFTTLSGPAAPVGLTATAINHGEIKLIWQANTEPDLEGYIIYRDYVEIARADATETSYTDSGLTPDTEYTYGIMAYNTSLITSDMSNAATVTTPKLPIPVLTAKVNDQNIKMSWTGTADRFLVMVNGNQVDSITDNQYIYNAIPPGTYVLQVIAIVGTEQYSSAPVSVKISAFTPPSTMVRDVVDNAGIVLFPVGGLLSLALGLKASPLIVTAVKAGLLRKFF